MPTEFEMSFKNWTSKGLLDAIGVLAEHGVNLSSVVTFKQGDKHIVRFLSGMDEEVRRNLMKADLEFTERKILVIEIPNRPGQWLKVAKSLVETGVEIESSYEVGQREDRLSFAFGVSDYAKARTVCGKLGDCSVD